MRIISFDMFRRLFAEFGCEIVVINDTEDKAGETEIFEEIISCDEDVQPKAQA